MSEPKIALDIDICQKLDNAVIIIDKPPKMLCHEVTANVKRILGAKRAGHAGTLDPGVTGVLPIAVGKATKLLRYIAPKEKTYIGIIKFRRIMEEKEVKRLFERFTGEITQTPPKESAVRKAPRKRRVYHLKLLERCNENQRLFLFETRVDAGTYIRTLCDDIGKLCGGARMEELRRIAVGDIKENMALTMQELVDAVWVWKNKNNTEMIADILNPPEKFINFPKATVKNSSVNTIITGAQIMAPAIKEFPEVARGEYVAIYDEYKNFIGVGKAEVSKKELEKMERGIAIRLERVHYGK